tara:strand:+ start:3720 stop:4586 length:867 start_codon:yes stop_codon:yes gene_type:complete
MGAAFEQAWSLLKAAYMPQSLDEILGHGSWRAAVEEPEDFRTGPPRVTKVGGPFNVASHVLAGKLAEEHPELVAPEEFERAPGGAHELPEGWEVGVSGEQMRQYNPYQTFPVFTTQARGIPIEGKGVFDRENKPMRREILMDLYENYPLAQAMKLWDAKGENWAAMPQGQEGFVPPSMVPELGRRGIHTDLRMIDPMFADPQSYHARLIPPRLMGHDPAQIRRVASEVPTEAADIQEFMEPWYQSADQYQQLSPVSWTQEEIRQALDQQAQEAEQHLSSVPRAMTQMA